MRCIKLVYEKKTGCHSVWNPIFQPNHSESKQIPKQVNKAGTVVSQLTATFQHRRAPLSDRRIKSSSAPVSSTNNKPTVLHNASDSTDTGQRVHQPAEAQQVRQVQKCCQATHRVRADISQQLHLFVRLLKLKPTGCLSVLL